MVVVMERIMKCVCWIVVMCWYEIRWDEVFWMCELGLFLEYGFEKRGWGYCFECYKGIYFGIIIGSCLDGLGNMMVSCREWLFYVWLCYNSLVVILWY